MVIILLLGFQCLPGVAWGKSYLISCHFTGTLPQSDVSLVIKPEDGAPLIYKSAILNNYAVFSVELAEPAPAYLLLEENDGEEIDFFLDSTSIEFVIHPGQPLKVQVLGSGSTQRWKNIKTNLEKIIGGHTLWSHSQLKSDSITLSDVLNMRDTISTRVRVFLTKTIWTNPAEEFSWYLFKMNLSSFSRDEAGSLLSKLIFFADRTRYRSIKATLNKAKVGDIIARSQLSGLFKKKQDFWKGKKRIVLLDFCLVFSEDSRRFHRSLQKVYAGYHHSGFEMISIYLYADSEVFQEIQKTEGLPWSAMSVDGVGTEQLKTDFGIINLTGNVLLDARNKVVRRDASPEEIEQFLKRKYD